jgi:hypothetical protein
MQPLFNLGNNDLEHIWISEAELGTVGGSLAFDLGKVFWVFVEVFFGWN